MNNDHKFCISLMHITVSDFTFLSTRFYHVEGMRNYITAIAHQATPPIPDISDVNLLWKLMATLVQFIILLR